MTRNELNRYWKPAANNLFEERPTWKTVFDAEKGYMKYHMLDEALGLTEYHEYFHSKPKRRYLSIRHKKLLRLLASPHGKTILKAYRIKRGLE